MVSTFASNGEPTAWGIAQLSTEEVRQLGKDNPTFDRADRLWQEFRCWAEGQNLEMASTKPRWIGQIADVVDPAKSPTIEETQLTIRTNRKSRRPTSQ